MREIFLKYSCIFLDRKRCFYLYEYQKDLINTFYQNRYAIALTGRQLGKSNTSNTFITYNKTKIKIKNLFKMSIKLRLIDMLENLLIKLSKY